MGTFLERLVDEKLQLDEKSTKLESFVGSENFQKIDQVQQSLLKIQLGSMKTYSECLAQRLFYLRS